MSYLIAKIRVRGQGEKYWKLLGRDEDIYRIDTEMSHVPYTPDTKLDEDEWFSIDSFSKQTYCLPILLNRMNTTSYPQFRSQDFSKLDYLFSYQGENAFCFQNITKSQLVRKKTVFFNEECSYSSDNKSITIHSEPDAIYLKSIDRLYFKKLAAISSIFKGISELFREATYEETRAFLSNPMISLANGFNANSVKTPNRKRIALAISTLHNFGNEEKDELFMYIHQYCSDLDVVGSTSFAIGSEIQLKSLLYGIEQRYYTTPIGLEKRLANSVRTL